jgi:hypothetical protein
MSEDSVFPITDSKGNPVDGNGKSHDDDGTFYPIDPAPPNQAEIGIYIQSRSPNTRHGFFQW